MGEQHSLNQPLIVAFVNELMVETRIENAAHHLGFRLEAIGTAEEVGTSVGEVPANQAGEPLFGRDAELVSKLTASQPSLLIFDLANEAIPWRQWLGILKSSPATRRMPVLAFGPHVATDDLDMARQLATDRVVARSRFMASLPDLIKETARQVDSSAINLACTGPLSEDALRGLEAFREGDFFEAHEHLEDAWNQDDSPARDMYKGVLQVAVAYLQIERGNYAGAVKMFLRARQWLDPLPDICRGVDIAKLRADAEVAHQNLLALGPKRISQYDRSLLRPATYAA